MKEYLQLLDSLPNMAEFSSSHSDADVHTDGDRRIEYNRQVLYQQTYHQLNLDVYHHGKWEDVFALTIALSTDNELDVSVTGISVEQSEDLNGKSILERFRLDDPRSNLLEQHFRQETNIRFSSNEQLNGLANHLYERSTLPGEVDVYLSAELFLAQLQNILEGDSDFDNPILVPPRDSLLPEDQLLLGTDSFQPEDSLTVSDRVVYERVG